MTTYTQMAALAAFCIVAATLPMAVQAQTPETSVQTATGTEAIDENETAATERVADIPRAEDIYEVTQLRGEQDFGDFVVGPGKFDITVAPNESETVILSVTNRTGEEKVFSLTTEDMTGSSNLDSPTVLLGDDRGPYTLRDYISMPADRFTIAPGQRVQVPVTIALPADAEPGGRYGSLLVQTTSKDREDISVPTAAVVSRIAVLFFVTTPGDLERSGDFVDLTTVPEQQFFTGGPITFGILYENTGTVHTNPAGEITITNMFGQEVGYMEVAPWFALPQSLRLREVEWDRDTLLGRYTATANVYLGYDKIIDTKSVTFWVIDWVIVASLSAGLIVLFALMRFVAKRFTLVRKDS